MPQNVTLSATLMSDLVLERLLPRLAPPPRQLLSHVAMLSMKSGQRSDLTVLLSTLHSQLGA